MVTDLDQKLDPESGSLNKADPIKTRDPLVGTTLDNRFYIERVLGTGGMSVVYKAKQLRVNRYVAIKTIRIEVDTKSSIRERFQREINSLCALSHPNIVTVYDCIFGWDDQPYIVMDYLKGLSLEELIKKQGPLDLDKFAGISLQVLSALEHAHKKGIIHRDLKPGNIVLLDDETDIVKVVDFGLAKLGQENRRLTKSGELWGSPPYMSPEQAQGEPSDYRSDIYSLGAVMYEMLTGKDPFFDVPTVYELIQAHVLRPPPSFESMNPDIKVPAAVEAVIRKALQKPPLWRYQSITEFQNALVEALSGQMDADPQEYLLRYGARSTSKDQSLAGRKSLSREMVATIGSAARASTERVKTKFVSGGRLKWMPWTIAGLSFVIAVSLAFVLFRLLYLEANKIPDPAVAPPVVSASATATAGVKRSVQSNAASAPATAAGLRDSTGSSEKSVSDTSEKSVLSGVKEPAKPENGNSRAREKGKQRSTRKHATTTPKSSSSRPSTSKGKSAPTSSEERDKHWNELRKMMN